MAHCGQNLQSSRVLFSFLKRTTYTSLALEMERNNISRCFGGLRLEDLGERRPRTFLVNNFSFLNSTEAKTRRSVRFLVSFAAVFRLVTQRSSLVRCVTSLKTAAKETNGFQVRFEYRSWIKAAAWTLENKNGNANYYFEVEFSF